MNIILEGPEELRTTAINYIKEKYYQDEIIEIIKSKEHDYNFYFNSLKDNSNNKKIVIYNGFLFSNLIEEILDNYKFRGSMKECKDICKGILLTDSFVVFMNKVSGSSMEDQLYYVMNDSTALDTFFKIGKKAADGLHPWYLKMGISTEVEPGMTIYDNMSLLLGKIDEYINYSIKKQDDVPVLF